MVECSLLKKMIKDEECFDIQMCSEGLWPKNENPYGVKDFKDFQEICLLCDTHDKLAK